MLQSIFSDNYTLDSKDNELVIAAQNGNRNALEKLIFKHQNWIYNITLRMVGHPEDAEDITQEILIKIITKLSSFKIKSSFRTWIYRITANHVINMRKHGMEILFSSFDQHKNILNGTPDMELPDQTSISVDTEILVEETKIKCMMGMLLCLNREQRLVFTLGAILGANSQIGAEILEISPENFRKKLSRAREHLKNYMNGKCGLIDPGNKCRCARKTKAAIKAGYIDPEKIQFNSIYIRKIKNISNRYNYLVDDMLAEKTQELYGNHPLYKSPDFVQKFKDTLNQSSFRNMINFN